MVAGTGSRVKKRSPASGSDNSVGAAYSPGMCFSEVPAELPLLIVPRRQLLMSRAVELEKRLRSRFAK